VVDLAAAYHEANDQYRAIATLARAVATYPGDARLYALYAQYIRTEADTVVPRGLAMFPKSAELLTLNANMLRARGKLAESLASTKKAVALDSTISDGDLAIAQLELQVGQVDSALISLHHSLGRGSDSALVAQFALTEGNTLYRAASGTKTSSDFGAALNYLTFADSVRSTSQSRFLVGAAALGMAQSAVVEAGKAADTTDRCRLTRLGETMVPVARNGLQAGEGELADAAKQSLEFLDQFEPYVLQQLKSRCCV
jgi:tetratricopeptide (TPR) repeat protein